jgi:hypothetical protein
VEAKTQALLVAGRSAFPRFARCAQIAWEGKTTWIANCEPNHTNGKIKNQPKMAGSFYYPSRSKATHPARP